jgi:carbamoyltransferase
MYVLGINPGIHDGSACIVKDEQIIAFLETDRISRKKMGTVKYNNMPAGDDPYITVPTHLAVGSILAQSGLTLDDIDAIAIGWLHVKLGWTSSHLGFKEIVPFGMEINEDDPRFDVEKYAEAILPSSLFPRKKTPPIYFVGHHKSHAASGFYNSGFEEAAIIVVDGYGDKESTSIFHGIDKEMTLVKSWNQSIGNIYDTAAQFSGLGAQSPGKLMGLAPYGKPMDIDPIINLLPDGYSIKLKMDKIWSEYVLLTSKENNSYNNLPVMEFADFAATIQKNFRDTVFHLANLAMELTGSKNVVFAGGCGQNCSFSGEFAKNKEVNLFVPPVPHDCGISLGAALYTTRNNHSFPKTKMNHAYYGYKPSDLEIESTIERSGFDFKFLEEDELIDRISDLLIEQNIVGWYRGRAEIGARALGARSLLMDPRNINNWEHMNYVKNRESWRPLAPSVLKENAHEFFEETELSLTNFMLGALIVKEEVRSKIPATVHVDGTARPQFVDKETNPSYHALISAFYKKTGVPVVMNTSFNLADEPIVHSPQDAINSFIRRDIDVLVINNYVLQKHSSR